MPQSEQIDQLAKALVAFQAELPNVKKDANNPFFKSKYADLASCMDTVRPLLAKHGLAVIQPPVASTPPTVSIDTILIHESGQWLSGILVLSPVDAKPQSAGSAITYGRRYALQCITGLAAEDDDGNNASGNGQPAAGAKAHIQATAAKLAEVK